MNSTYTIEVRVVQDEDVCITSMVTPGFDHITGSSKRHPNDDFNHAVGECVAFGRLFENLSEHYKQIVIALQNRPEEKEDPTEVNMAEAMWLQQYGVPPEEMGVVLQPEQIEQGEEGNE